MTRGNGGGPRPDAIVVGGGVAGLACAVHLHRAGCAVLVLEASDRPGGRVATDLVDGFRLDRGFQVLLTAYPEARDVLDLDALELRPFYPGAAVYRDGALHRLPDPWREPMDAVRSLPSPLVGPLDAAALAGLRRRALSGPLDELFARPETTTEEALRRAHVSTRLLESFFRPFLGGIFLESGLETSSRMFELVFRMFALGRAAVPADGMGAIPAQLEARLPAGTVRTGAVVTSVASGSVGLADGETLGAGAVVLAAGPWAGAALSGRPAPPARAVVQLSFDAPSPPLTGNVLVLDGDGSGPVNNLAVMSEVAPSYAPPGRALVSASVLGDPADDDRTLDRAVRRQLGGWFGAEVVEWRTLRIDRVRQALPASWPAATAPEGVVACGDHTEHPSLQGALASGRRAALEALVRLA